MIATAVGAVALAGTIAGGTQVGRTLAERHEVKATPTPVEQTQPPPTVSPTVSPSASPSMRPSSSPAVAHTGGPLFNLGNHDVFKTALDIPASSGCPPRTVRQAEDRRGVRTARKPPRPGLLSGTLAR
ncbi:hypothetical protein [Fodinicola acaciae]|uniref:hypothetical protein n=1 Tax=Fodinicola acaciae TaxID=2681555 RepID=UPI0013D6AA49|nr:hypothetical protein [Fodinicola acaciae]